MSSGNRYMNYIPKSPSIWNVSTHHALGMLYEAVFAGGMKPGRCMGHQTLLSIKTVISMLEIYHPAGQRFIMIMITFPYSAQMELSCWIRVIGGKLMTKYHSALHRGLHEHLLCGRLCHIACHDTVLTMTVTMPWVARRIGISFPFFLLPVDQFPGPGLICCWHGLLQASDYIRWLLIQARLLIMVACWMVGSPGSHRFLGPVPHSG